MSEAIAVSLDRVAGCRGPDGCFDPNAIMAHWHALCGCWVVSCLLCGNYDGVVCFDRSEEHADDFNQRAIAYSGEAL